MGTKSVISGILITNSKNKTNLLTIEVTFMSRLFQEFCWTSRLQLICIFMIRISGINSIWATLSCAETWTWKVQVQEYRNYSKTTLIISKVHPNSIIIKTFKTYFKIRLFRRKTCKWICLRNKECKRMPSNKVATQPKNFISCSPLRIGKSKW